MSLIQATILGLAQGLTEFLPISSSGHLVFIPKIFNWEYQGLTFDVMVHLGTFSAVVVYFRKKIWELLLSFRKFPAGQPEQQVKGKRTLFWLILLTIIPSGVIGLWFGDWLAENTRAVSLVGASLIFWGLILAIADRFSARLQVRKSLENINWKNALFIGVAQAVALIPGTSRSGITMTAGLFSKLDKTSAAEFSFLMSIPIIALAGGLKVLQLYQTDFNGLSASVYAAGFLASMFSGFFAIWFLLGLIKKWSFLPFAVYRIVVGIFILIFIT